MNAKKHKQEALALEAKTSVENKLLKDHVQNSYKIHHSGNMCCEIAYIIFFIILASKGCILKRK